MKRGVSQTTQSPAISLGPCTLQSLILSPDLSNFVFDCVRATRLLLELVQVGKELPVHKVAEVVSGQSVVVVEFAVLALGCGPAFPTILQVRNVTVFLAFQRGLGALVLLKIVEVFEEQQPRRPLGVIEFAGATRLFTKDVIDVSESLFKLSVLGGENC